MALNSGGFDVTNIPRAQAIEFNLQPGQYTAGLNSGIGAYNAFNNIAEEVRDRPLKQKEREARLAQIEAEAQVAPLRKQLAQIDLARAKLPQSISTGKSYMRVPRADSPEQYDLVEQDEGFELDVMSGSRTPYKRTGKMLSSAEEIAHGKELQRLKGEQIKAETMRAQAYADAEAERKHKNEQDRLFREKKFADDKARMDAEAGRKGWGKGVLLKDANGNAIMVYTNPVTKESREIRNENGVWKPIVREDPWANIFAGPAPTTPPVSTPTPKPATAETMSVDALADQAIAGALPIIPATSTPLSTSKGYKIIPR